MSKKFYFLLYFILCFAFLTEAQITKRVEEIIGRGNTQQQEHQAKSDSIVNRDSLKIIELTQQIQQMRLNEINYLNELEESRSSILSDSLKQAQHRARIDSLRAISKGAPLIIAGDTIFKIYASRGGTSALERVDNIKQIIDELGLKRSVRADSIKLLPLDGFTEIMYNKKVIMSVTKDDAIWMNMTVDSLANIYRKSIVTSIKGIQEKNSLMELFKRIFLFIAILVVQYIIFYFMTKLYRKIKRITIKKSHNKFKPISIRDYEFLNTTRQARILIFGLNIIRYLLMLLQLLITVPMLFAIFPQTKDLAHKLFGYILTPIKSILLSIITYIPNLFTIIIIWLCIRYVVKGLKYVAKEVESERLKITGFYPDWAQPSYNIIRFLLYAFMIAMIYPYLPGSSNGVFQGISVFVGLIVSLGSSTVIANIIAGLVITYMRPFRLGDRIKLNDTIGNVIEKTAFVTRIKTVKNEIVTIPNSFIMSSHTVNYSASAQNYGLILHTTVSIGYDTPWETIHELLIKAALKADGVLHNPQPFVLESSLEDFYPVYQLNAYINDANRMAQIYSNIHQCIQDVFNEAGVEILSPHYRAERDGNQVTIPDIYNNIINKDKKG